MEDFSEKFIFSTALFHCDKVSKNDSYFQTVISDSLPPCIYREQWNWKKRIMSGNKQHM